MDPKPKDNNYKYVSILLLLVGIVVTIVVFNYIPEEQRSLLTYIGVIGTFASVFGLLIAYLQIISLKQTSRSIKSAVDTSTHRLNTVLAVSELAKSKKMIEEIQILLQHDDFGVSLIRIKDFKELLIQNKYNSDLHKLSNTKEYKTIIINTGIDITAISNLVNNEEETINKNKIIENLESARTKIIEFENELKHNHNDSK